MSEERFKISAGAKKIMSFFLIVGVLFLGWAFYDNPTRAWSNVLLNNFYFLSLALAGTFLISIHYVSNASWATGMRRVPEAMMAFLPVALVLMLVLCFGVHDLYHWSHHDAVEADAILKHKSPYLNMTGFIARIFIFFLIWIGFSRLLRKNSLRQDVSGNMEHTRSNVKTSAIFIVLFALTYTLGSYDWMMSLEPHWFSTIFSIYTFAGLFLHGIGMMTLIVLILLSNGYLKGVVNENHLHDLGKFIFAFSVFWAYCWFCQYMLIWYANIPEETAYFIHRQENGWFAIFIMTMVLNWLVPFFLLMPRSAKRNKTMLWIVSISLLIAHWLDVYVMVVPSTLHKVTFGHVEYFVFLGYLSLFLWVVLRALSKVPTYPYKDPYLEESLHLHQ